MWYVLYGEVYKPFNALEAVGKPHGLNSVILYFNKPYIVGRLTSVEEGTCTICMVNEQWHLSKTRGLYKNLGFPERKKS